MEREGIIVLRAVHKQTRSVMEIGPTWDSKRNRWLGGVKPVDANGQPILSREERDSGEFFVKSTDKFEIFDKKSFDLTDPQDAKIWEAIRHTKMISEGGKNLRLDVDGNNDPDPKVRRYGMAVFYVERPDQETKMSNDKKKLVFDAKALIYNDSFDGWIKIGKILKRNMSNSTKDTVEQYLINLAEKSPMKIINSYKSPDSINQLLLFDAVDKDVINKDGSIYRYGTDTIGTTEAAALSFVKDPRNKPIVDEIRTRTYPEWFETKEEKPEAKAAAKKK